MSQVVKAITATKMDRVRMINVLSPLLQDVFSVREDIRTDPAQLETQYRIGVTIGSECFVSELDKMKSDNALSHAIERTKRQVIEAIFGEFRQDFRMIERDLYDRNIEAARVKLHELEKKMFEEY
jgi:hypothetical protein